MGHMGDFLQIEEAVEMLLAARMRILGLRI